MKRDFISQYSSLFCRRPDRWVSLFVHIYLSWLQPPKGLGNNRFIWRKRHRWCQKLYWRSLPFAGRTTLRTKPRDTNIQTGWYRTRFLINLLTKAGIQKETMQEDRRYSRHILQLEVLTPPYKKNARNNSMCLLVFRWERCSVPAVRDRTQAALLAHKLLKFKAQEICIGLEPFLGCARGRLEYAP